MPKQLIFYELTTPISKARHESWSVDMGRGYRFAAGANSVPLMTVEFIAASHVFPIVFSVDDSGAAPVAVLGLDANKSLFVAEDGAWMSSYIPAFVRRYPFVFSQSDDENSLTLCIDEAYEGCDREGAKGQRLFDDKGERTPYLQSMLEFTNAMQGEHRRSTQFGALLRDMNLLEPSHARIILPGGEERSLSGFQCVSRDRLKELPATKLKELAASDALELIYLHLYSMRNFEGLLANSVLRNNSA
jgi:SapC